MGDNNEYCMGECCYTADFLLIAYSCVLSNHQADSGFFEKESKITLKTVRAGVIFIKFILLFGPQAVGKMTVGHELTKVTDLKLFHNHMSIEFFHPFFGFGSETWRLSNLLRREFFESFANSNQYGLIFTYVWGFDLKDDWNFVKQTCEVFESAGADIYFVELESDLEERLKRNKTPYRLDQKPTKRNIEQSEKDLLRTMETHRLNSNPGEIVRDSYLRINNTNLSAEEVAILIKDEFKL